MKKSLAIVLLMMLVVMASASAATTSKSVHKEQARVRFIGTSSGNLEKTMDHSSYYNPKQRNIVIKSVNNQPAFVKRGTAEYEAIQGSKPYPKTTWYSRTRTLFTQRVRPGSSKLRHDKK